MKSAAGLAYRESGDPDAPALLLVHGYPESSYMWRDVLPAAAAAGWRAVAPDLAGYGDSPADPPGTWERHVEALERFRAELGLDRVVLGVHDWGGLIGLRWACDHPGAAQGLIVSCTGFFPDGKWHGLAEAMRAPGQGEELIDSFDEEGFRNLLRGTSPRMSDEALGEYWKAYSTPEKRRAQLELYRSGDFDKLEAYAGQLTALGLPTLILWGEHDPFAPVAGAHRFARELPGARVAVIDAGHFVWEDEPERCAAEVTDFLGSLAP